MRLAPLSILVSALLFPAVAQGQVASAPGAAGFTIGPTIGTLGAGIEGGYRAGDYLGFRLDASALAFDYHQSIGGIPYKLGVQLRSGGPMLDVYPFGGGFRITGGVRVDGNDAKLTASPTSSIQIGSNTYTPAELGTLTGKVEYNRYAPYLGIGYAGRVADWLALGIDAGVLYQGGPRVSLAASGSFATNPTLQSDLDRERASIKSKIGWTAWYPSLTLSALFRF